MTVYQNDPTRNSPPAMTVFYFSHYNPVIPPEFGEAIAVFYGTQAELNSFLGHAPGLTFAVFNNETTPPTLVYRAAGVKFSFKDVRKRRDDFPQFYIGLNGDIWDADSFSKIPVIPGPGRALLDFIAESAT